MNKHISQKYSCTGNSLIYCKCICIMDTTIDHPVSVYSLSSLSICNS